MRRTVALTLIVAFAWPIPAGAQVGCSKPEFEAVVDEAAAGLRDLNSRNKPAFQEKLKGLKDKRGWSYDVFLTNAAPFVRDDTIADYDYKAEELLARINSMGFEGSSAKSPDCALLAQVRATMRSLVEVQKAKWDYMFAKLEKELSR